MRDENSLSYEVLFAELQKHRECLRAYSEIIKILVNRDSKEGSRDESIEEELKKLNLSVEEADEDEVELQKEVQILTQQRENVDFPLLAQEPCSILGNERLGGFKQDFEPLIAEASSIALEENYPAELWIPTVDVELQDEANEEQAERVHALFFAKLFLFIVVFDLNIEYYSLLTLAFFLHVNGVFRPALRWYRNLGRRRETGDDNQEPSTPDSNGETPQLVVKRPPYIVKILYQTIFTFCCSLVPDWHPNPWFLEI